jgi:hypothetical protein
MDKVISNNLVFIYFEIFVLIMFYSECQMVYNTLKKVRIIEGDKNVQ